MTFVTHNGDISPQRWKYDGFQTFAVFWMFYSFFWVIPRRLNFIWKQVLTPPIKMEQTECSETSAY